MFRVRSGERVPCLSSSARKVAEYGQSVRAHHLQAYWAFLVEQKHDWRGGGETTEADPALAEFVSWVRHATRAEAGAIVPTPRSISSWLRSGRSTSIRTGLEWRRRSAAPAVASARRVLTSRSFLAPYQPNTIVATCCGPGESLIKRPATRVLTFRGSIFTRLLHTSAGSVHSFLCLLHESGMRIGQALGLRHADIRSYDGAIDIVPRANSNGALAKSRSPYVVHVSKQAMALYADYLVHEHMVRSRTTMSS